MDSSLTNLNENLVASFYLYDHLGNTRVVYHPELQCPLSVMYDIEFAADYYPYGKMLRQYVPPEGVEKFLTTQHERDQETGLDYRGARFYDSDVARFLSLDPLAADYPSLSDYSYVAGNPIQFIDPTGKSVEDNGKTYDGRPLGMVTVTAKGKYSDEFYQLSLHEQNFLLHQWRMMEEGNLYKRLLGDAIRQGATRANYEGYMDQSGWWDKAAQKNWQDGYMSWREGGAGKDMMRIASVGIGVPLIGVAGGSILGSMALPTAGASTISISATTTFVGEATTYGYIVGESAVSTTVTTMSRFWVGRMALTGGSLYTGTNLFNMRTGFTPKLGLTTSPSQKSVIRSPLISTGNNRYYDGFYAGNFRFQIHSHRINGSSQYIPHINVGIEGRYHVMLNSYGISKFGLIYKP